MLQAETVQLLCLTAASGVPLFSRGSSKQLPFSVIGSLNGVHMFGAGQGALLSSCETEQGSRVVWRVFQDSLMLIAVSGSGNNAVSELHLRRLLENTWNCMVLVLGQDELANMRNVERLKRELRSCYRLIDRLLERGGEDQGFMGDLTHCADCLLPSQPAILQQALDSFTQAANSEFGCLLIQGRVALATEKWWRLAPQEVVLLSVLVNLLSGVTSCDYPVFLPQGSPTVAHRLLCFQLLPSAVVCVLCGPSPSLHRVESELVGCFWSPVVETLRGCLEQAERSPLPPSVSLRWDVQALLLINRETRRSVVACPRARSHTSSEAPPLFSPARRWELLRHLYTFAVTRYFTSEEAPTSPDSSTSTTAHESLHEEFSGGFTHQPVQCYLVTDECKCYGLQTPQHQLYLLTDLSVPTFALRSVATHTLNAVTATTGF
ncbi:protein fuzzy homolog [Colossoma macropomum]|uniref:protein fuzzy homolog n=1 Tax=Colossoma macropomum TaxID=42526 RepID=UPI001863C19B|nr:protein fuzzy homolog [Colossoma macropomum]XP_036412621.1 protein fuzzy homolog [Colossoma macropomum]XP_036412622.1 protein fuzzy homolog [Colossoma macropomum]XP_036412623.1 protein fuzzy homolog [Colossoma macropomum]